MNLERAATPPPPSEDVDLQLIAPPLTPGAPLPRTVMPPSPDYSRPDALAASSGRPAKLRAPPMGSKRSQAVGIKKAAPKVAKIKVKIVEADEKVDGNKKSGVSLMDLPGEIRNLIYSFTSANIRQALLVYRPRLASLRSRTRLDRHRTLPSDIVEQEQAKALPLTSRHGNHGGNRKPESSTLSRETNRPFFGLTQVCRVLRAEFRPLYLQKQEVGMDLTEIVQYLRTFYPEAPDHFKALSTSNDRQVDMPFTGNLTIAVGDKVKDIEKCAAGIDVCSLLDLWANSHKIEAGFGRYMQAGYDATTDGEAKDLYRLFGRRVQPDRRCSAMNAAWRTILRTRSLAAIKIHRKPASTSTKPSSAPRYNPRLIAPVVPEPRPYIHILFRVDTAEPWMTKEVSTIPQDWLQNRGFDHMEFFEIKVGVATASAL